MSEREDNKSIQKIVGTTADGIWGTNSSAATLAYLRKGGQAAPVEPVPLPPSRGKTAISQNCLEIVKHFEGLHDKHGVEIRAYKCPADVWTIGYGTIMFPSGVRVKAGDVIDEGESEDLLHWELSEKVAGVLKSLDGVPASQDWLDAYVSLAYNIGTGAFNGSTTCRLYKEGDLAGAADAILLWNKGGGKVLAGLVRRRESERNLALGIRPFIVPA